MTSKFVSVVIPSLNEELNVGRVIKRVNEAFKKYNINGEIILIDASSTDNTVNIAKENGATVYVVPKIGLGYQYIRSLEWINGDYVIMGDSDGTYDFMEMDRFIKKLDEGFDFVMGTRIKGEIKPGAMPFKNRYIGTPMMTFFINLFFKAGISDMASGLRALTKDAFKKMKLESTGWEYAGEMIIKGSLCNLKITEVPITLYPDSEGRKSHLTPWKAGWENMKYIWLLASEVIFIKVGFFVWCIGFLILFSQIFGPVTIFGKTFGTYYMFLGLIFSIIGLSTFQLGIITQNFTYLNEFKTSVISDFIGRHFTFERGVLLFLILFLIGFVIDFVVLMNWLKTGTIGGFEIKMGIYGLFFFITGIQIAYFSFVFYLFNKYKHSKRLCL